jgi:hypothetical protein
VYTRSSNFRRAIIDCDEEALTEERLGSLLKNCVPSAEEMELVNPSRPALFFALGE